MSFISIDFDEKQHVSELSNHLKKLPFLVIGGDYNKMQREKMKKNMRRVGKTETTYLPYISLLDAQRRAGFKEYLIFTAFKNAFQLEGYIANNMIYLKRLDTMSERVEEVFKDIVILDDPNIQSLIASVKKFLDARNVGLEIIS